jgi:hypothetical protein
LPMIRFAVINASAAPTMMPGTMSVKMVLFNVLAYFLTGRSHKLYYSKFGLLGE